MSALGRLAALKAAADAVKFGGIDTSLLSSSLTNLRSKLQSLGIADIADINVQPGRIMTQLQLIKRLIGQAGISDVLDFNVKDSALADQLAKIHGLTETIPVSFDIGKLPTSMPAQNISDKFSIQGLDTASQLLDQAKMQTDLFSQALAHLQSEKDALIEDINLGLIPSLARTNTTTQTTTRTFGGWGGILTGTIGGIGLWHLALDGVLESTIALGSAAAALTIGIATMVPTAQDIYTHLQAVSAVNSALGAQIPPLTGQFDALASAMAPQTIEAYGGALNLVNTNGGTLAKIAGEVVTGLDDWIAKLDLWSKGQNGFGVILQNGVGFLHQFEGIVNSVGVSLANLVKADPGTAHFLLDVVGGAAKLLEVVTSLPTPILASGLALHSFLLWGGAAIGVMGKLPGPLGAAGKAATEAGGHFGAAAGALRLLATSPWAWAAAGATALGVLAYEGTQADSATKGFIDNLNAGLANEKASQAIGQISVDIGEISQKMQGLNSSSFTNMGISFSTAGRQMVATFDAAKNAASDFGSPGFWGSVGRLIEAPFTTGAASAVEYQNDINKLNSGLAALVGQQGNLFAETGVLMKQGYSYSQSLALMDMAGVKAGDSFALMQQKVANLVTGYQNLVAQGGMLNNAVNAVTFASELQGSKVSTLNQGWDSFMSTITGGASAFTGFAQQVIGLYQSLSSGGVKLSDSSGKVSSSLALLASTAGGTAVSMTGLNSASLLAQQTFIASANSANSQMDALTTLAAAAGLGTTGTDLLARANKDLVSALLPAAAQSSTMTTILYALAQRGGYTGADSFQQLSKWVGNTRNPMLDLQGVVGTLTTAAGNLTTDVQNLSTALGTTLNNAMATAIFDASGGQKTFDNFATAILTTGTNSSQTRGAALSLADGLYHLTGNVGDARSEFESFAQKGLGLTATQADSLWKTTLPGLQSEINSLHGKTIPVDVTATAQGTLNAIAHLPGQNPDASSLVFSAAGGPIVGPGGPTADRVPVMASNGEFMMQASAVNKYGTGMMSAINAGRFASGGLINFDQPGSWAASNEGNWGTHISQWWAQQADNAFQSAAKAAAVTYANQGTASAGPGGGSPAANYALAQALYPQYKGTSVMAAWNNVAMRESGWNQFARNASSGAYGIPQALPPTKMPFAAQAAGGSNPTAQIEWMWNYMASTYGGPIGAWQHELSAGWYDNGGILKPGLTLAYNGTGQDEYVSRGGPGVHITLELGDSFKQAGLTEQQLEDIRYTVRTKGGGNAQQAFGRN
jgi:hypothetical protein